MAVATALQRLRHQTLAAHGLSDPVVWEDCRRISPAQCLEVARAVCLTEDDFVSGSPCSACETVISPRNEAAALSLLLAHAEDLGANTPGRRDELHLLCDAYLDRAAAASNCSREGLGQSTPELAVDENDASAPQANLLHSWCRDKGVQSQAHPALFAGSLRGMAADADLEAGSVLMSVPVELLVTAERVAATDLGAALSGIPGLDEDTLLLMWTMCDRHDTDSEFHAFWNALPAAFNTGLSVCDKQAELLRHTPLYEEATTARQHVRQAFAATKPLMETLVMAYSQFLKPEFFCLQAYLWAVELWYAYSIKVQFPDGSIKPALVPLASLINHSPFPHVVYFSKVDPATNSLRLRTFRKLQSGEQCFLSYGPLTSAHMLLFYGFVPDPNPFDTISLSLTVPSDANKSKHKQALAAHKLDLEQPLQVALRPQLPAKLLATLRVLAADASLLKRLTTGKANPQEKLSTANEAAAMALLKARLQKLLQELQRNVLAPPAAASVPSSSQPAHLSSQGSVVDQGSSAGASTSSNPAMGTPAEGTGRQGVRQGEQATSSSRADMGFWGECVRLYVSSQVALLQNALSLIATGS